MQQGWAGMTRMYLQRIVPQVEVLELWKDDIIGQRAIQVLSAEVNVGE